MRIGGACALIAVPLTMLTSACGGAGQPASQEATDPAAGDASSPPRGKRLVEQRGCLSCHTTNGRRGPGPTFEGLAGSEVKLSDGRTVTADRDYLLRAILDPDADTVAGFPEGLMAGALPAPLTNAEAEAVVRYLQDL